MISGQKAGFYLQYPQEMIETGQELVNTIRKDFEKQRRELLIKKSIRVLKWNMNHGHNGDDFIKNLYSVVFTGKGYKVPRIVKKILLK